ncbi:hypothetical protein CSAL01_04962 [Colletotrichum salicis]|uniref:Uncharacterized protein n=1 Tax=Colletotrichum salicis TaxID=1209931 RepID=A0A135V6Z7_9PEZI|nr:hypothetical protein CSAL01_04962 [Colletotrichum salicis]
MKPKGNQAGSKTHLATKASRAIRPTLGAVDQRALEVDVVEAALKTDVFEKWRLKPMLYKDEDDEEEEEEDGADEPKDDNVGVTKSGSATDTQPRTRPRAAGPNVRPASCPIGFILLDRFPPKGADGRDYE